MATKFNIIWSMDGMVYTLWQEGRRVKWWRQGEDFIELKTDYKKRYIILPVSSYQDCDGDDADDDRPKYLYSVT